MSTLATAPESAGPGAPVSTTSLPPRRARPSVDALLALLLAAGLLVVAFATSGGVDQTAATAPTTWTEIALTVLGSVAVAAAVLTGARGPAWGIGSVALMTALAALTALSITWSLAPDISWSAANQMLSYLAAFAGAVAVVRLAPQRWRALLGAIALTTVALSGWALLAKVFPDTLAAGNSDGRLQAPFGYWNVVGLVGAIGVPACLWLGAPRDRGRLLAGLAAPGLALTLAGAVLSSSRSADAVVLVGIIGWTALTPVRLRSVAMLAVGAAGAAIISGYALATSALSGDNIGAAAQDSAGHRFGLVLVGVLVLTAAGGWATARAMDRVTVGEATRRRIGIVFIGLACLVPIAAVGALALSSRGLTGEISYAWSQLTSTRAVVLNNPGRVLQFGSSRPLYWHEGIDVGEHALLKGMGASAFGIARLRYTTDQFVAQQAHSYVVETFADLGLLGLAVSLALLLAWAGAVRRPLTPGVSWRTLPVEQRAEREGMIALALVVLGFGIQSTVDWTWYFPGIAVPVLVCAGWLAGRGPLTQRIGRRRERRSLLDRPGAVAAGAVVAAVALAGAWLQWQPLRSAQDSQAAEVASSNAQAFADARAAAGADPLAYLPRFQLSQLYVSVGDLAAAHAQLVKATQIQPQNPETWLQLGLFELQHGTPVATIDAMAPVLPLDHTLDYAERSAIGATQLSQVRLVHAAAVAKAAAAKAAAAKAAAHKGAAAHKVKSR